MVVLNDSRKLMALAAAIAAAAVPTAAAARDHYYFNKPNIGREAYAADIAECSELAGGARAPKRGAHVYVAHGPYAAYGVAIGILFAGLLTRGEDKKVQRSVERTCMADKGYARMKIDKKLIDEIEEVKDEEVRIGRMFDLAAAEKPIGTRMDE